MTTTKTLLQDRRPAVNPPVRRTVAIASGKGGVGKTTVSVNLAVSLADAGYTVGLLDADIYGPNIPQMMGIRQTMERSASGKIVPLMRHGVSLVSVGFLVGESDAVIYRGPLVGKMIKRFLADVEWGVLDYLLVDLPPGTGDASLTLAQSVVLTGTVIVTTPQQVALADVRKSITMFQRLNTPILGIVENMSYFMDEVSGTRTHIFGQDGGKALSRELDLPFLGEIPLNQRICACGDVGEPIVKAYPDSDLAAAFRTVRDAMITQADSAELSSPKTLNIDFGNPAPGMDA